MVPILLRKLVVLTPVKVQQQPNHIELEVALRLYLQDFCGVLFKQDEDALLFQITPKRVAACYCKAGFSDFARAVEFQYRLFC
jgi:hypothetical protein